MDPPRDDRADGRAGGSRGRDMPAKPRIMYLFDDQAVPAGTIDSIIIRIRAAAARDCRRRGHPGAGPELLQAQEFRHFALDHRSRRDARQRRRAAAGLAAQPARSRSPIPRSWSSAASPCSGTEDLLSRTMALSWVFNLAHERDKTVKRQKIHVNNCAVRTDFFRAHPFPDLPAFKKQCVFWLRGLAQRRAQATSAPPTRWSSTRRIRASSSSRGARGPVGMDSDYLGFQTVSRSWLGRLGYAFRYFAQERGARGAASPPWRQGRAAACGSAPSAMADLARLIIW